MKILSWDIEATNLSADFGMVLCVGFKEVGTGKPTVLSLRDFPYEETNPIKAEKHLLKALSKVLLDADMWVYQFGKYYDLPFINTRLLYHKLPTLPTNFPHVDTWQISKNHLKLRNNKLVTISEFLGTREEKNAILPEQWIRALAGHKASLDYIVEHCRRDVVVLEEAYLRLRALDPKHPFHGRPGACRVCGKPGPFQYRGFHRTAARVYRRFQCQQCGAWDHDRKAVSE